MLMYLRRLMLSIGVSKKILIVIFAIFADGL